MPSILIDLSILRHPFCGLGQLAIGYGNYYAQNPDFFTDEVTPTLLVPKAWVGKFGDRVNYLVCHDIYRFCPWLMPHYDVWHSIHQLSPFRPASRNTRRVLTIHDVNFVYEKQGRKRQKYIRRLQHEVDASDEICFISNFSRDDALRFIDLKGKQPKVVYSGAESIVGSKQSRPAGLPDDGLPFLLSLGVLKPKKNTHTLIPMMEHVEGYRLVIAGAGGDDYAEGLRAAAAKSTAPIYMAGAVSDEERNWLMAHCSGFLFPSLFEGFGRPVIEAMQWGKPVFCSTCTSIPEFGAEHAFYFPDFTPEGMAETVKKGLATFDKDCQAREIAYADSFSYDRHMSNYLRIYKG